MVYAYRVINVDKYTTLKKTRPYKWYLYMVG